MLGYSPIELYAGLLIALPLALLFLLLLIISVTTLLKWRLWRNRKRRAERLAMKEKHRPDGLAYPPAGRAMCDACQKAHEKVYHMPSGRRLCADCYESLEITTAEEDDCTEIPPRRRPEKENI
ncbi:MAG: hypothetical protein KAV00_07395 [Phycisphaerae bacterium]|nr:hypothetical protein [Phycisphaerae bacterium]